MLIVIEGIAGSGKTTLINELMSRPEFKDYERLRFPNRKDPFPLIKGSDNGHWFLPAALATAQMVKEFPNTGNRQNCIVDRYCFSTMAYQMTMGMPYSVSVTLPDNLQTPDITAYIGIDVKTAMERIAGRKKQKDSFEKASFLEGVAIRYPQILQDHPGTVLWLDGLADTKTMADIITEEVVNVG